MMGEWNKGSLKVDKPLSGCLVIRGCALWRGGEFYLHAVFAVQNQGFPVYFVARHTFHGDGKRIFQLIVFAQHDGGCHFAQFQAA